MTVSAVAIVDRLELVITIEGTPRRLVTAIEGELRGHFGLAAIRAAERAESISESVARIIAQRVSDSEQEGLVAGIVLLGVTSDSVAGGCHILPTDSPEVAAAKQRRLKSNDLLTAIRSLTFSQFEKFGARVLAEIGASYTKVTPHSNDQGIDFYGHLSLGQYQQYPIPFVKIAHDVVLGFAGQAKHYPNTALGPDVVRELIGAVSLARTKTFSQSEIDFFPGLELKPFSPLVTLLFTTGTISSGAIVLAESAGVIARSGSQIAVFLADKGIGIVGNGADTKFDNDQFLAWLNAD